MQASDYLEANDWDLASAVESYYIDMDEHEATAAADDDEPSSSSAVPPDYTGPRTLDGRPAPQAIPTISSAASKRPQKKKGLATLSSITGGSGDGDGHGGHGHGHDDDDDDEQPTHRDTYAGGEKSGLAVQDPNRPTDPRRIINDLLAKAKR